MWIAVLPLPCAPSPVLNSHHHNAATNNNKKKTNSTSFNLRLPQVQDGYHFPKSIIQTKSTVSVKCSSSTHGALPAGAGENLPQQDQEFSSQQNRGFWRKWRANSAEMSSKLAKLGLAAVLAYGLFDGVTYTTFFVLAFLGYEKSTGKNPAANLQALLGIVILMWTGNNITRPFRVAGAAALAPVIDKGLRRIQKYLNFPNLVYAFALVVGIVAALCLTVVGLLILSRWGKRI